MILMKGVIYDRKDLHREGETPKYKHDCATCVFLGRAMIGFDQVDMYLHNYGDPEDEMGLGPSFTVRHSDEPSDNWSDRLTFIWSGHSRSHEAQLARRVFKPIQWVVNSPEERRK